MLTIIGATEPVVVRVNEKLRVFLELRFPGPMLVVSDQVCQAIPDISCLTYGRGSSNCLLDYVIRRFNLSSARLNKPQGLDLR